MRARPRTIAVLVLAGVLVLASGTLQPGQAGPSDEKLPPPKAGAKQPATVPYEQLPPNVQYGQLPSTNPQPGNAPMLGTFENRDEVSQRNRLDKAARGQREKPLEMGTASKQVQKLPPPPRRIEMGKASKHVQKLPPTRIDPKPIDNGPERMAPRRPRKGQPGATAGASPEPTTSNPARQRTSSTGPVAAQQSSDSANASTSRRAAPAQAGATGQRTLQYVKLPQEEAANSNASTSRRTAPAGAGAAATGAGGAARPAQVTKGPSVAERRAKFETPSKPAATMQARGQRMSSTTPPANPTEPAALPKARKRKGGP
ncbi:MAG: hypothetical protein H6852_07060 [Geminicoccaceae bacterium]|jgi:hypothetical protein|nr:hypothetical protein [Geminicoccaceae bacterium]MCB9967380.1 hypothetical protein [Geminicoccaceae bacterium]HRY24736.1 hypothetical protein [Geminicoccaceae bacterium]